MSSVTANRGSVARQRKPRIEREQCLLTAISSNRAERNEFRAEAVNAFRSTRSSDQSHILVCASKGNPILRKRNGKKKGMLVGRRALGQSKHDGRRNLRISRGEASQNLCKALESHNEQRNFVFNVTMMKLLLPSPGRGTSASER